VAQPDPDPDTGETARLTDITQPRIFLGGGEGLLSTGSDYMRFALMLANGGKGSSNRVIATVIAIPTCLAGMASHAWPRRIGSHSSQRYGRLV
jgi:hypothetical protein